MIFLKISEKCKKKTFLSLVTQFFLNFRGLCFLQVVEGSVFETDRFGRRFNFGLGVLVGVLDFKTATKLFL